MKRMLLLVGLMSCLLLAACSEDDPTVPPNVARLTIEVRGLPPGLPAQVFLAAPDGNTTPITATRTFDRLSPGRYTVSSERASDGFGDYYPTSIARQVDLVGGGSETVVVAYAGLNLRGGIIAAASGLPDHLVPTFTVAGPGSFESTLARGDTVTSLAPGTYHLSATRSLDGVAVYAPWPETITVSVEAGAYSLATLPYAPAHDVDLDLTIDRVEFTQATQRADGTVPLIVGRDAVLRIHGLASTDNEVAPPVLVEWFDAGTPIVSEMIERPATSTPTSPQPGDPDGTWNLRLPAALVAPGLGIRVSIDPDAAVPEAVEANNTFPPDGGVFEPALVERPVLGIRLVPVLQEANGLLGDATDANAGDYTSLASCLMPVPAIDVDVHEVYTTSARPLQPDNANSAWAQVLSEIGTLQLLEDTGGRHYYGVVKCDYTSGIAGLGRLPGMVAMGWDHPGSRARVLAHELGHNLGLAHVDCGGPAQPDPDYPYPDGSIGQWGFDLLDEVPRDPSVYVDLMSYCQPQWISDYMYEKVLAFTAGAPAIPAPTRCLVVWGRRSEGRLILEPALVVHARPSLPRDPGPYLLLARDRDGRTLLRTRFAMPVIADLPGDDAVFAWAIPLPADKAAALASLELSGPEGRAVAVSRKASGQPVATPRLWREQDLRLAWDAAAHPLVVVRRGGDGVVLGMLRGGHGVVRTAPGNLDLLFSDGIATERVRVAAP